MAKDIIIYPSGDTTNSNPYILFSGSSDVQYMLEMTSDGYLDLSIIEDDGIVTSGLTLNLDSGDAASYPGTGTTWYDLQGTNDGTFAGDIEYLDTFGGLLYYPLTDSSVELLQSPSSGLSEFTLGMWVFIDISVSSEDTLYNEQDGSYWQFKVSTTRFITRDTSTGPTGGRNNDLTYTLPRDEWIYVTAVYSVSGGFKRLYVNGVLETESTNSIDALNTGRTDILIGIEPNGGDDFHGFIPVVQAYDRALTQSEIQQNYDAQKNRFVGTEPTDYGFRYDLSNSLSYSGSGTNIYDLSSNGYDGTLYNGPTYSIEGGGSLLMDGTDDIIITNSDVSLFSGSYTLSVWFKFENQLSVYSAATHGFIGGGFASTANGLNLSTERFEPSGTEIFTLDVFNDGQSQTISGDVDYTQWNHYLGTFDNVSGTGQIYINGSLLRSGSILSMANTSFPLEVGSVILSETNPAGQRSWYSNGYLGDAAVWNRHFTQGEVMELYTSQKSRFN